MNAILTLESTSRRAGTRSERFLLHRLIAPTQRRRGFTLIEMMVTIIIAACLIGWYVRAHDEADSLSDMIRRSETMKVDREVHQRRTHLARAMPMNLAQTGAEPDARNNGETAMGEADASGKALQAAGENEPGDDETDRADEAQPLTGE